MPETLLNLVFECFGTSSFRKKMFQHFSTTESLLILQHKTVDFQILDHLELQRSKIQAYWDLRLLKLPKRSLRRRKVSQACNNVTHASETSKNTLSELLYTAPLTRLVIEKSKSLVEGFPLPVPPRQRVSDATKTLLCAWLSGS